MPRPKRIDNKAICVTTQVSTFAKEVATRLGVTIKELAEAAILKYCEEKGFSKDAANR